MKINNMQKILLEQEQQLEKDKWLQHTEDVYRRSGNPYRNMVDVNKLPKWAIPFLDMGILGMPFLQAGGFYNQPRRSDIKQGAGYPPIPPTDPHMFPIDPYTDITTHMNAAQNSGIPSSLLESLVNQANLEIKSKQ